MIAKTYNQSALARTVFYLLCLFLVAAHPALAAVDPAYTVEGVDVDMTAKNAVLAREKALEEAQVKAYSMLAERFMSPEEFANFKAPDAQTISMLVQDFEVTNEQLSTTRYKGVYTIRFRPTAFKSQLGAATGQAIPATTPKPVLVLPMLEQAGSVTLWAENNPWMRAWRNLPVDRSMIQPSIVPLGDADDLARIGDSDGLRYDPMRVQDLATKYKADDVAILLASVASGADGRGQLIVNIYSNGFEGPRFVQKMTLDSLPDETDDALYTRAATRVRFMLRESWKANAAYVPPAVAPTTSSPAPGASIASQQPQAQPPSAPVPYTRPALGPVQVFPARAVFSSAQEWVRMKNALDKSYGMNSVMIRALKPREAFLELRFAGNATALQSALQPSGLMMRAGYNGAPIELYFGGR
jgi:hypothetical protein